MKSNMKTRLAAGLTAGAMMLAVASPAMAQVSNPVQANAGNLIAVLNNLNVDIDEVRVVNVDDSFNNNDIRVNVNALQNFLNNNNVDLTIEDIQVLNNAEFLNNNVVVVNDISVIEVEGDRILVISV